MESVHSGFSTNVNDLPDEVLEHVFSFLSQNKLGQIARVCRKWSRVTENFSLWRTVDVKFHPRLISQNLVIDQLLNKLPANAVIELALDFRNSTGWNPMDPVDFTNLADKLAIKWPRLNLIVLKHCILSNSIASVIDTCTEHLPFMTRLILRESKFLGTDEKLRGTSNLELLEISGLNDRNYIMSPNFDLMTALKELYLYGSFDCYNWFSNENVLVEGKSIIGQLTVLNVGFAASRSIFSAIKTHCSSLRELYVCNIALRDEDLRFNPSTFPQLKTICLRGSSVSATGVASLGRSCPSLINIFVEDDLLDSFNGRMASIVKGFGACRYHLKFT